ncbi:MAG: DUF202 domain-containing protein [Saprospiraceae bacterium]|nr:DUF202 domain-containing protein [Pyrinomonadaceae bacterium]
MSEPLTSNELAVQRTDMALGRTVMALERTLMAWLRTSVALISFGFTIYKILEGFQEKGHVAMREHAPRNLGLFLILLGMGLLILGIVEYRIAKKTMLEGSEKKQLVSVTLIGSFGVLLVGVFMLLNMFFGIGGL